MEEILAPMFKADDYEVRDVDQSVARQLVERHHYARGGPNTGVFRHGLFARAGGDCLGVAWWLPPTRVAAESVSPDWQRVIALSRLVIVPGVPKNACTFLLGASIRKIRKDGRFLSLVTYADESQGHEGTIYRASNWEYVGRTKPEPRFVCAETGRQVSRKCAKVSRTRAEMEALGYRMVGAFSKHKFVMRLGPQARAKAAP